MESPNILIVDLDGTLADCSDRIHYLANNPKDWDSFHLAGCGANPIPSVTRVVNALADAGAQVIILTGRSSKYRIGTEAWLHRHIPKWNRLFMRGEEDFRHDTEYKGEFLDGMKPENVLAIFEDREKVVAMARLRGFTVFHVAPGAF